MPRIARLTKVKAPHHVYQRTANKRVLFGCDKDRLAFLEMLQKNAVSYKADILAWCLMRHHFNLLIVPLKKDSLPRVIGRTLFDYSNYIAKKRKIVAPFWHNRFQSCIIDEKLRSEFARYVECQPVYAGRVQIAEEYRWSSAQAHITWEDEHGLLSLNTWPLKRSRNTWSKTLAKKLDEATCKKIRIHTQTGRPMGSDKFIASLEKKFKRSLKPLPVGRPRLNQE